ncbi:MULTISPECIES: DUF2459 domain-containing protein [unclassified Myroides]|uniref:DUF2459 domain-containing protein n=1 Tax=unclassified Myroides TaxID=2642485 RepID=UPI003D2F960E
MYVVLFYALALIPVIGSKKESQPAEDKVLVFLSTNGVHTDFVVPLVNPVMDWRTKLELPSNRTQWLAFGWGDRGFYLDTPSWGDLRLTTALRAISGTGDAAMHVTAYRYFVEGEDTVQLTLTRDEYLALVHYIDASFQAEQERYKVIEAIGYGKSDMFYEAKGSYSLFYTCNTWVNQGLKRINQNAALWTLHDQGIFRHYK